MGNLEGKKYHITDEGDVYRINDDGSFTSMGNAENISENSPRTPRGLDSQDTDTEKKPTKAFPEKKKSRKYLWIFACAFLLIVGVGMLFLFQQSMGSRTKASTSTDSIAVSTSAGAESMPYVVTPQEDNNESSSQLQSISSDTKETEKGDPTPTSHYSKQDGSSINNEGTKNEKGHLENNASIATKDKENHVSEVPSQRKTDSTIDPNKVYYEVEVMAEFPGGDRARTQWLRDHISWPRDNNGAQLHGDVELEFVIERNGSVSNVKVTYSDNPELNSAAVSLISSMPNWIPAKVKNQPVRSFMGISLYF